MEYTLAEELLIDGLVKDKIRNLHDAINQSGLSERQKVQARLDLLEYQELQFKNRLKRQIGVLK